MTARHRTIGVMAAMFIAVATHACAPTHTDSTGAAATPVATTAPTMRERGLNRPGPRDSLLRDPPDCVVLLPTVAMERNVVSPRMVDEAVERFLAVRFDRVVAGAVRDRMARRLALDLRDPRDLGVLADQAHCNHALEMKVGGGALAYAVVWAERRVTLALSLKRIGGGAEILWSANAAGARGDGGLPVSPLGVLSALFRAGRVVGDKHQARSLLDDVLREMMASLPDVRELAQPASGFALGNPSRSRRFTMNTPAPTSRVRR